MKKAFLSGVVMAFVLIVFVGCSDDKNDMESIPGREAVRFALEGFAGDGDSIFCFDTISVGVSLASGGSKYLDSAFVQIDGMGGFERLPLGGKKSFTFSDEGLHCLKFRLYLYKDDGDFYDTSFCVTSKKFEIKAIPFYVSKVTPEYNGYVFTPIVFEVDTVAFGVSRLDSIKVLIGSGAYKLEKKNKYRTEIVFADTGRFIGRVMVYKKSVGQLDVIDTSFDVRIGLGFVGGDVELAVDDTGGVGILRAVGQNRSSNTEWEWDLSELGVEVPTRADSIAISIGKKIAGGSFQVGLKLVGKVLIEGKETEAKSVPVWFNVKTVLKKYTLYVIDSGDEVTAFYVSRYRNGVSVGGLFLSSLDSLEFNSGDSLAVYARLGEFCLYDTKYVTSSIDEHYGKYERTHISNKEEWYDRCRIKDSVVEVNDKREKIFFDNDTFFKLEQVVRENVKIQFNSVAKPVVKILWPVFVEDGESLRYVKSNLVPLVPYIIYYLSHDMKYGKNSYAESCWRCDYMEFESSNILHGAELKVGVHAVKMVGAGEMEKQFVWGGYGSGTCVGRQLRFEDSEGINYFGFNSGYRFGSDSLSRDDFNMSYPVYCEHSNRGGCNKWSDENTPGYWDYVEGVYVTEFNELYDLYQSLPEYLRKDLPIFTHKINSWKETGLPTKLWK